MIDPQLFVNLLCLCLGTLVGIAGWRTTDKKTIAADAMWRATVDETLKNVEKNTDAILASIDRSDERIRCLEDDVLLLKQDVSALKDKFEEGSKK